MYGEALHNHHINYIKQFWEAYPDNRKIFRTHFSEAHEISGELVQYIDTDVRDMLEYFYVKGYFNDTILMLISDHGAHSVTIRVPIIPDNSRYIENYLPMLFHLAPTDLQSEYLGFLESNQQSFINSYDIYSILYFIAENKKDYNYAYIAEQIPEDRE